MYVDVAIPTTPSDCRPIAYDVSVVSAVDYSNRSIEPGNQNSIWMPLHSSRLHLVLRRPILDLPPYIAIAEVTSGRGADSSAAKLRLPQRGDYCLRHHPKQLCEIKAQYLAMKCMRGEAPRSRCADWSYGSQRPFPWTPVKGATAADVQQNLRLVLQKGTYNDVRLTKLTCTPRLACVATFARRPQEGIVRVRYLVSGYKQKPGCWFTSRTDVIEPPQDRARSPLQGWVPANRQSWCLSWRKP